MCRTFGYLDPKQLMADMDAKVYQEWLAYYALDPWDEGRGDTRNALLIGNVVSLLRSSKSKETIDLEKYMPYKIKHKAARPDNNPQSFDELEAQLASMYG